MQYFTKEELEDITNSLLQEPSRETLKRLNDKYNKEEQKEEPLVQDPVFNKPKENTISNFEVPTFNTDVTVEQPEPKVENIQNNIPSFNLPELDITNSNEGSNNIHMQEPAGVPNFEPIMQTSSNIPNMNQNMSSPNVQTNNFEVPTPVLETNSTSFGDTQMPRPDNKAVPNQSNEPVNFSGNLWQQSPPEPSNLMDTTDNFKININSTPNMSPNTNQNSSPFFGTEQNNPQVNNPIPVRGQTMAGPSMFGQIMQNQ